VNSICDRWELTLDEILADPIVVLLMHRDGVYPNDIRRLMRRVAKSSLSAPPLLMQANAVTGSRAV